MCNYYSYIWVTYVTAWVFVCRGMSVYDVHYMCTWGTVIHTLYNEQCTSYTVRRTMYTSTCIRTSYVHVYKYTYTHVYRCSYAISLREY